MNKVTASSLLLVLQRVAEKSLGLVGTLILARLLTPEDFGFIAIAMLIIWFVENFSNAGTEIYILQKEKITDEEVHSAWTLDLLLKSSAFVVLIVVASFIAFFRGDNALGAVISVVGLSLPLKALTNPGLWLLKRSQDYSKIVKTSIAIKVCTLLVMIPAAFYIKSFWAIIIGQLFSQILTVVNSYYISSFRPKLNVSHFKSQWDFSKWLIPQEVLGYFRHHIDTIIVTNRFSVFELGAYNNLKYFATIPMLQILVPAVAPLHAELGKVQNNRGEMEFQFGITIDIMAFIAIPFAAICFVASNQIVLIFLGHQWVEYHNVFGYFSLLIVPYILLNQSSRVLLVKGKTKTIFVYELITTIVVSLLLLFLPVISIEQFAMYRLGIEFFFSTLFFFYVVNKIFEKTFLRNYFILYFNLISTVFVLYYFQDIFVSWSALPKLIATGLICLLYVFLLFCIWRYFIASKREKNIIKKFSPFN
jgi:lipopolysaccharide exporter